MVLKKHLILAFMDQASQSDKPCPILTIPESFCKNTPLVFLVSPPLPAKPAEYCHKELKNHKNIKEKMLYWCSTKEQAEERAQLLLDTRKSTYLTILETKLLRKPAFNGLTDHGIPGLSMVKILLEEYILRG